MMKMVKELVYWWMCLGVLCCVVIDGTVVTDCGSVARVDRVDIEGCIIPPCVVTRPDIQDVNITFTPDYQVESFSSVLDAYFGDAHYPWPGPGGCDLLTEGGSCPLLAGHTYHFHSIMPVLSIYPELSVVVTWFLEDENNKPLVCIRFPVIIL
ncbi:hypothetical protein Pmani_022981 [Petrolisthes manimaculis]|uniref:MD-2-related lipid-recognition domain-containing protein n=1 Tax=Petrolisthes manimaculis TaxID=1843537 RepID=A0AAE1U3S3_9EUCA|nr:hypothetical protein Pmani_022981 [Petrolisthes manimaculis]